MPYKLSAPLVKRFELEETDKKYENDGEPTFVTIRQATQEQNESRQQLFADFNRVFKFDNDDQVEFKETRNVLALTRNEVYLTLVDSNILDKDGNALFKFKKDGNNSILDMSLIEFSKAWGQLPGDVCAEIHSKVREVNLTWSNPMVTGF